MSQLHKGFGQVILLLVGILTTANPVFSYNPPQNTAQATIVSRLENLDLPLNPSSTDAHLQRKIADYLGPGIPGTERMLGRANQYFPVFEYYLHKHGMPASLKYLAVAESMLVPGAISRARAAGLWQLMPSTARELGLRVDNTVDERLDIHRSTEAAVLKLKELYAHFGDWHLALAAYNCGQGRVRRAVRQSGGYTFYPRVKPYLPKESQQYVAAYVAAAYAVNYYDDYGLTPRLARNGVENIRVRRQLSLRRTARACGISYSALRRMNPMFVRGVLPASEAGYDLRVPAEQKYEVQQYIWDRPNLVELPLPVELETAHSIAALSQIDARALLLGCAPQRLIYEQPSAFFVLTEQRFLLDFLDHYEAVALLEG